MEYNTSARGVNVQLKEKYDAAEKTAQGYCQELLGKVEKGDFKQEDVYEAIEKIVRAKYFLEDCELQSNYFNYLGELSIARMLGKDISEIKGIDLEAKCNGTSSVMTKKILLFMFVNHELGIAISAEDAANSFTLQDLTILTFAQLSKRSLDIIPAKGDL